MRLDALKQLGLTGAEIKIYYALIRLGRSTTGNIVSKSEVSSSKVYQLLDRLIEKGLVSHSIIDGVKHYSAAHPSSIEHLIDQKEASLKTLRSDVAALLP